MIQNNFKFKNESGFCLLDNKAIDSHILKKFELLIYVVLIRFANNETGACYPSLERIASCAGVSRTTTKKAIKSLEEKGILEKFVRVDENGQHTTNIYKITRIANLEGVGRRTTEVGRNATEGRVPHAHELY